MMQMTRRRWWLVGVLGVVVVLRAAAPELLRRQIETRASDLLGARVAVDDVDLGLFRGVVALDGVTLRPREVPAAGEVSGDTPDPPVVSWDRLAVNLSWWPLVHKVVQLSLLELDGPRISLDRLADGEMNLLAFVPATAEDPEATADSGAGATPWGVGFDRIVVRRGHLRFRDFAVDGANEPVDVRLPTIDVRDVGLSPGVYGGPARASVDVRVDDGRLRINTRLWLRAQGVGLHTTLRARRMPLERVRLYVPDVGWRELEGKFGASLEHRFEPGTRNFVRGTVTLDDVEVHVPDVETAALAWKHLLVDVAALDLEAHEARVDAIALDGATVVVQPEGGLLLPALARGASSAAAEVRQQAGEDAAAAPAAPPAGDTATPSWRWSVKSFGLANGLVHVSTADGVHDLGVEIAARDLAGQGDQPAPVKLSVTHDASTLTVEGNAQIASPGFDGTVVLRDLDLPAVPLLASRIAPSALRGGRLGSDLRVAAGSAADPAGDVTVTGTIDLAGFDLAGADPKLFGTAFDSLSVGIEEVRLPGVLAPAGTPGTPITVGLARVALARPRIRLTRTPEGLVLPMPAPAEPAVESPAAAAESPAPAGAPAGLPPEIRIAELTVTDGELRVADRSVQPFFTGGLAPFALEVRELRLPAGTVEHLQFTGKSLTRGRLDATGRRTATGAQVELTAKDVALEPFNPYATHYSPYSIAKGALSVTSKATVDGAVYDSTTKVTLDGFDLGGKEGDSLFKEQFGISLEVALALLRDVRGRIALDIPVAGDEKGSKVGVGAVAGQALRRALVNALASPLKLLGAAFGGTGEGAAPAPIVFAVGRAEPTATGAAAIESLGELLASRPGIGITLSATPTEADVRWLHEQALREALSRPQGMFGAIGGITKGGARERIRVALEARATGGEGALDADDSATLEEWLAEEQPAPSSANVRALATARLERVATILRDGHGVAVERVASEPAGDTPRGGEPVVSFTVGVARRPAG